MSDERKKYLKRIKSRKYIIVFSRLFILLTFFISWQILSDKNIINSFLFSSPIKVIKTIYKLYIDNNLLNHIIVTIKEVFISLILSTFLSLIISTILYYFKILKEILDPFITIINSMPKVALGPFIVIIIGANQTSIIVMSLLISLITTFTSILNGFNNIDTDTLKLFKVFNASKKDLFFKLIIPSSKKDIITSLKINLSLSLIGIITGEFLSCKEGIGYLILYGTQVFNLSLVLAGILLLLIISYLFYLIINIIDKRYQNF